MTTMIKLRNGYDLEISQTYWSFMQ